MVSWAFVCNKTWLGKAVSQMDAYAWSHPGYESDLQDRDKRDKVDDDK